MQNKLWTKDFTTITLGSVVSMMGNSIAGFAMSLFVLDYMESTLLYAIYIFLYTLPQIAAPVISGPLMDRFSRRRTIYALDFCSATIYILLAALIFLDYFNFGIFATVTFIIGTINSVYMVAFESFYPMLITEGNYSKAYSISGTLQTMTFFMLPLATVAYNAFGLAPLLAVNSVFFFIAAVFETRISDVESVQKIHPEGSYSSKTYFNDMKDGIRYLISEKGLLAVTLYFTAMSVAGGASQVITLPWFKGAFDNGEYLPQFSRNYDDFWWATGFVDGQLKDLRDSNSLRLLGRITFESEEQAQLFAAAMKNKGFAEVSTFDPTVIDTYKIYGKDVIFLWQNVR